MSSTTAPADAASHARAGAPTLGEITRAFFWVGVISFGGAAGQIAMMHKLIVDEKKWLDDARFLHALNYCMLLPGPEAQQLATYVGWLLHGVRGGLIAGLLFVAPGALLMLGLSFLYALGTGSQIVDGVFFGIKAAVLAIILQALIKISKRGLKTPPLYLLALVGFLALLLLDLPFPLIVLGAGAIGALAALARPELVGLAPAATAEPVPPSDPSRTRGAFAAAAWCLAAWWAPIGLAALALGADHVVVDLGLFFSKLAVLTFGGAYAVLAWLAQAGVEAGWVSPREMIDGLGLAETTPGPTILVNQFVAFLGAMRAPGGLDPMLAATLGALIATWATFAPSFLWIFAGAPFVDALRRDRRLAGALAGVTAAVVGVVGYVGVWFALHVLFRDVGWLDLGAFRVPSVSLASLDPRAAALSALAFGLVFGLRWGVLPTVGLLALLGVATEVAIG